MQMIVKIAVSVAVILAATAIGKKIPSAAGLVGVMPLTGALVLVWTYVDSKGNPEVMRRFTGGAMWGILPTLLFFLVAFLCFRKNLPFSIALPAGFGAWLAGAFVHQWLLR